MADDETSESTVAPSADDDETMVSRTSEPADGQPAIISSTTQIGPFRLLDRLGEGGFGIVHLAEQKEPVERQVALKIIKPGMGSEEILRRFAAERQALAMMEHPNIATVLDAGTTHDGRLYFVMELVRGMPITKYCDEQKLRIRDRLKLFLDVCAAIQHAHQKGIIHRDIKPSNILVTTPDDKPVVKVIDFGIAKALDQSVAAQTVVTTEGQMIGTPQYMSPEQACTGALDVDTRSDIYALGVLLYELLTGVTPISADELRQAGFMEMVRLISESPPQKPSLRVGSHRPEDTTTISGKRSASAEQLTQMLRGDLDWIVLKALEKERDRRYVTARGFALDIERFLKNEPVSASPPTLFYLLGKFAQRHRGLLTAATVLLITLLVSAIGMSLLYFKAERERIDAEMARADADEQRRKAVQAEAEAKAGRALAEREAARADREADSARASLLAATMQSVTKAWEAGTDSAATVEMNLMSVYPVAGQKDHRNFVWRLLWKELHQDAQMTLLLNDRPKATFTADGRLITTDLGRQVETRSPPGTAFNRFAIPRMKDEKLLLLSPSGKTLEVRAGDVAHLYSTVAGEKQGEIKLPARTVRVLYSCGGGMIATLQPNRRLSLWNAGTGDRKDAVTLPAPYRYRLEVTDGGTVLLPNHPSDGMVGVFDSQTDALDSIAVSESALGAWALSEDGQHFAARDQNGLITVMGVDGSTKRTFQSEAPVVLALSTKAARLAIGRADGKISIFRTSDGNLIRRCRGHTDRITEMRFSATEDRLVSIAANRVVKVWSMKEREAIRPANGKPLRSVQYSRDGKRLVMAGDEETIIWNVAVGRLEQTIPFRGLTACFSPDGDSVVIGNSGGGSNRVWNLPRAEETTPLPGKEPCRALAFSPDGKLLVVGDGQPFEFRRSNSGRMVNVWDFSERRIRAKLPGHRGAVAAVCFTGDGRLLVTGCHDGRLRVWSTSTWELVRTISDTPRPVLAIAISPDDKVVAAGGAQNTVNLFDLESGDLIRNLGRHDGPVTDIRFLDDGNTLASAGFDGRVKLWNAKRFLESRSMKLQVGRLEGIAVSPQQDVVFAAGEAGELSVVSVPAFTEIDASPLTLRTLGQRAVLAQQAGEMEAPRQMLLQVLEGQMNALEPGHRDILQTLLHLGGSFYKEKDFAKAAEYFGEGARQSRRMFGDRYSFGNALARNARMAEQQASVR